MRAATSLRATQVAALAEYVEAVAWSPSGEELLIGSMAGEVGIVAADGTGWRALQPGHAPATTVVAWSPDGRLVCSGGHDGRVVLRDAATGAVVSEVSGRGWAGALVWRPNARECAASIGREVVRISSDGTVRRHEPLGATVASLMWTPDGRRLCAGAYGGLWWYEDGDDPVRRFEWTGAVLTAAIAPNGKHVATGNQDHTVHCWKLWSASEFQMSGYPAKIQHIAWSPDSRYLAVGSLGEVTVWDFSGRGPQGTRPISIEAHERHLVGLAFLPGARPRLVSVGADGLVARWALEKSTARRESECRLAATPAAAICSPRGDRIAVAAADGTVHVVGTD